MAVNAALEALVKDYDARLSHMLIYLLGRYNNDLYRLIDKPGPQSALTPNTRFTRIAGTYDKLTWRSAQSDIEVQLMFSTMHRAKGLTADIAIILNVNDSSFGMPAKKQSDPVLGLLLAHPDAYPYAEERRLFYVALIRKSGLPFRPS